MKKQCPVCKSNCFVKNGTFKRSSDGSKLQRFKCKNCLHHFSEASFESEVYQKKRGINHQVRNLLCSSVSMRRTAILLSVNRKTIASKLEFLFEEAKKAHQKFLESISDVSHAQLDDLITCEQTKCKPVSISLIAEKNSRKILGGAISSIPAFGHLAKISRKKYGPRQDERPKNLEELLKSLKPILSNTLRLDSDEDPLYERLMKRLMPLATHKKYKGAKSSVTGQGELKKLKYDPLFTINHSFAMMRANISRLLRRTWCISKKRDRLEMHVWLFIDFYNTVLLRKPVQI